MKISQIVGSAAAIFSVLPGARLAAEDFRAYELIWLIPFLPAFTVTFFWIVIIMVGHFIQADTYKDPKGIQQARSFLVFFNWLFLLICVLFMAGGLFLYRHFI